MKIAVLGSVMVDLMSYADKMPEAGETREAEDFSIGCGGKGANQAIAAAHMDADVLMIARVGDDIFGETAIENFRSHHVDASYVKKVPGVGNGMATVFVDASSQNRILIYKGANLHLKPVDIEAAAADLKQCDLLVLQLEVPLETVYAAIDFASSQQIPVLLNPAPASADLDIDKICQCEFFVPNETELSILTGRLVDTEKQIREAAEFLVGKGLKNVIVTMGEKGALWVDAAHAEKIASFKVKAVDTTGAGDAFIGSFAHAYVQTKDIPFAMRQGAAYAALSVSKRGTQASYPLKTEVEEFLQTARQL